MAKSHRFRGLIFVENMVQIKIKFVITVIGLLRPYLQIANSKVLTCNACLFQNSRKVHWSVYNMACPGNRMRWDLSAEDIGRKADELMTKSKAVYDAVGAVKAEEANFENVVTVESPEHSI